MQFAPAELGFAVDPEATLAELKDQQSNQGFWNALWGIEIQATASELQPVYTGRGQTQTILEQVFTLRYDQPPPLCTCSYTTTTPGQPGHQVTS